MLAVASATVALAGPAPAVLVGGVAQLVVVEARAAEVAPLAGGRAVGVGELLADGVEREHGVDRQIPAAKSVPRSNPSRNGRSRRGCAAFRRRAASAHCSSPGRRARRVRCRAVSLAAERGSGFGVLGGAEVAGDGQVAAVEVALYGQTADMAAATSTPTPLRISLGADWSPSGSKNLLGEVKVAKLYSDGHAAQQGAPPFSDVELVALATRNAAAILGWTGKLGVIAGGALADLLVIAGRGGAPYAALLHASEQDTRAALIGGHARFGTPGC